ncbi:MAG: TolC family protein [Alphaproteobacteria bacterium]|nr:TolC family protein [Alphaproteobacteria bacterium]
MMLTMLWVGPALAGEPLTLAAALDAARNAPEADLAEAAAAHGLAERLETRAWTNPSLGYQGYGRVDGDADAINGQQHQVDLGVQLPVMGVRAARLRRGRSAEVLGSAVVAGRRTVLAESVGRAWLGLLAAQARESVLVEARDRLASLLEVTERRAAEGAATRWDVDRLRLAERAVERSVARVRQERAGSAAALGGLLGKADADLEAAGDLREPLLSPDHPSNAVSPFQIEALAAEAYAGEVAREARRSRIPDPEMRLGTYWTTDGASRSLAVGVGWDLPVFDRGRGRVAVAEAERMASEAESRRVTAALVAERAALLTTLQDLRDATEDVAAGRVQAAAEVAWLEGEAGVFELVDAVTAEVDERLDALDLQLALRATELRLATLDGVLVR